MRAGRRGAPVPRSPPWCFSGRCSRVTGRWRMPATHGTVGRPAGSRQRWSHGTWSGDCAPSPSSTAVSGGDLHHPEAGRAGPRGCPPAGDSMGGCLLTPPRHRMPVGCVLQTSRVIWCHGMWPSSWMAMGGGRRSGDFHARRDMRRVNSHSWTAFTEPLRWECNGCRRTLSRQRIGDVHLTR